MTKGAKNRRLLVPNSYSGPIIVVTIRRNLNGVLYSIIQYSVQSVDTKYIDTYLPT